MVGLSSPAVVDGLCIGAALLGLWITVRFARLAPSTLGTALGCVGVALMLLLGCGPATRGAIKLLGAPVALLLVLLPILTFAFWSGAALVRLYLGLIGSPRG